MTLAQMKRSQKRSNKKTWEIKTSLYLHRGSWTKDEVGPCSAQHALSSTPQPRGFLARVHHTPRVIRAPSQQARASEEHTSLKPQV